MPCTANIDYTFAYAQMHFLLLEEFYNIYIYITIYNIYAFKKTGCANFLCLRNFLGYL